MLNKRLMAVLGAIVVLSMVLSACATPTPEKIIETVIVEKTVEVEKVVEKTVEVIKEVTPEPEPAGPKTLVICQKQEPNSLYAYSTDMLAASFRDAVYDGPYDARTYAYQPVIWEKLPNFEDGDAVLNKVTVQEGDLVVDVDGNVAELAAGMKLKPTGCLPRNVPWSSRAGPSKLINCRSPGSCSPACSGQMASR
jgi:hypothetical protein